LRKVGWIDAFRRFASGLEQPRATATESRLALVIKALTGLSEDTDTDKVRRIERLMAEQARIEREIEAIEKGHMRVLPRTVALERAREIISLADELAGDFRRVRDEFERLNRGLRASIMDQEGNRGDVLDALFAGIDLIGDSEAGRTFNAFWRLLTDPQQSATLDEALDSIMEREFVEQLDARERRFLLRLPQTLLEQGGMVHESLQHFARSLKHFVQSREYLEQRRINQLVREAQRTALALKDNVRATEIALTLVLTGSRLRSLSQWRPYDPALQGPAGGMVPGDAAPIDLETVSELVAQSEIDFRSLKAQILTILQECSQVSIGGVLRNFPASQGLGSVVGLLALGSRHGLRSQQTETVSWVGGDGQARRARIPTFYFIEERADELA
jgi:hypothetical protein